MRSWRGPPPNVLPEAPKAVFQQVLGGVIPDNGRSPGESIPVARLPGMLQVDKLPGAGTPMMPASPVVPSAVASRTRPPAKTGAVPEVDVTPSGPAPAAGAAPQPESEGSPDDEVSLVEVAKVPSAAKTEPVPREPMPGFVPAPVGLVVASVEEGLRPQANSSVVPRGIPAPPIGASTPIAPVGDGIAEPADCNTVVLSGATVPGMPVPGAFVQSVSGTLVPGIPTCCATLGRQVNDIVAVAIGDRRVPRFFHVSRPDCESTWLVCPTLTDALLPRGAAR